MYRRLLSTTVVRRSLQSAPAPIPRQRWRSFLQNLGRVTLATIVTTGGAFYYVAQKDRHPGIQLPQDPSKKTIVILGNGWAATSVLKSLSTEEYNVVVISPRNYFLFTPLLPSVTVGTLSARSIIQPTRHITRHKERRVAVYEGEAQSVDPIAKTVTFQDTSPIQGDAPLTTIPYDYLVYAVGAETQTFGIPGVKENSCFLKELWDAEKLRSQTMDCIESAAFPGTSETEVDRLLHMVVVGGGPTGVEFSAELHDFVVDDLRSWYPELADKVRITLIEALPSVLPMFSKQLISYTESTFKSNKIDILTKTLVKEVKPKSVVVQNSSGELVEIPFGLLVWAAGNASRAVTRKLLAQFPEIQANKRGIVVDDHLRMLGVPDQSIYALGDATATSYAPTAQVASQQGAYLGKMLTLKAKREKLEQELAQLRAIAAEGNGKDVVASASAEDIEKAVKTVNKVTNKIRPFHYSHQGSLAYIGSDKAIADFPLFNGNLASGGVATYLFWRSAYLSSLFSLRNRTFVVIDWLKVKVFGRDVSREA